MKKLLIPLIGLMALVSCNKQTTGADHQGIAHRNGEGLYEGRQRHGIPLP